MYTHTHTRLTALFPGLPGWAGTRKVKPIWILLEQETVSSSGISWAICKSAPRSRQITTPVPHHSVFYRPDALPAAQPTASKHWRHKLEYVIGLNIGIFCRLKVAAFSAAKPAYCLQQQLTSQPLDKWLFQVSASQGTREKLSGRFLSDRLRPSESWCMEYQQKS